MVYTSCQFPVFFYIIYMYVKSFLDQLFISTSTLIHACLYRYRDKKHMHTYIYSHGFWTANFLDSLCMWIHISIVTLLRSLSLWIYKRFVWEKLQVLGMYVILWNEKVYNHNLSCSKSLKNTRHIWLYCLWIWLYALA